MILNHFQTPTSHFTELTISSHILGKDLLYCHDWQVLKKACVKLIEARDTVLMIPSQKNAVGGMSKRTFTTEDSRKGFPRRTKGNSEGVLTRIFAIEVNKEERKDRNMIHHR